MSFAAADAKLKHLVARIHQQSVLHHHHHHSVKSTTTNGEAAAAATTTHQLVAEGIRNQLITRSTLPLLLQRILLYKPPQPSAAASSSGPAASGNSTSSSRYPSDTSSSHRSREEDAAAAGGRGTFVRGAWLVALQVLHAPAIDRFRVERHDSIWPLLKNAAPCPESQAIIDQHCKGIMRQTTMRTLGRQSMASQPSGEQARRR